MASTNACNFYIRYLLKNFIAPSGLDDKLKIISPHTFASHRPDMKKDLSRDLLDIFISRAVPGAQTLFLVPYCQGGHWMLIVVNPTKPRIGIMILFMGIQPIDHLWTLWLYRTNQALPCPLVKNGQFDDTFLWKKVKCPRHPKKSSYCGYCVMKFMKKIIMHNADTIPTQYFTNTYCTVYSSAQMEEIVEKLAMALFCQWAQNR
ncbi:uncharacterized protein LOC114727080 [Neltuma alba]|uniref:uncharacterized protein LOC114727080 n=1 Tax=Neltuma alba TaxID=207710 RepID=UPI0010A4D565|nr:uncharacterized protein LOC114727080 [Prosopis alba]